MKPISELKIKIFADGADKAGVDPVPVMAAASRPRLTS
jgi:hypothetical protein